MAGQCLRNLRCSPSVSPIGLSFEPFKDRPLCSVFDVWRCHMVDSSLATVPRVARAGASPGAFGIESFIG